MGPTAFWTAVDSDFSHCIVSVSSANGMTARLGPVRSLAMTLLTERMSPVRPGADGFQRPATGAGGYDTTQFEVIKALGMMDRLPRGGRGQ